MNKIEPILICLLSFYGMLKNFLYLLRQFIVLCWLESLETYWIRSLIWFQYLGVCWSVFVLSTWADTFIISNDHTCKIIRLNSITVGLQILVEIIVKHIHRLQHIIDVWSREETGASHVFLITGAIHTSVLKHCVHLEFLRVTSIEEAKHVVYSDSSVKNRTANEEIQCLFQTELSFVIKHGCNLARFFRIHHINSVVVILQNALHLCFHFGKCREFLMDKTLPIAQFIAEF